MSGSQAKSEVTYVKLTTEQNEQLIKYASAAQNASWGQSNFRGAMLETDKAYQRETNTTDAHIRARQANKMGDASRIQDVTVPIVMPQVESALSYLTNVFLTGYPIFGVSSDPTNQDAAAMLEAVIEENSITAGWAAQMMMFFRDGLKYNLHALECTWEQKTMYSIATDVTKTNSAAAKEVLWNGNVLRRMDLYNTFWDTRVHPTEVSEYGEYAGYTRIFSRTRMKQYINDLFGNISGKTAIEALESSPLQTTLEGPAQVAFSYYSPMINPFPIMSPSTLATSFDWSAWAQGSADNQFRINYSNVYTVTKLYARIIPQDFNISAPGANTPQVWKFVIVNGKVILTAERQSNVHARIPIFFGQPIADGLDYQTKSFATNVIPMQEVSTALWGSFLASKRRAIMDRMMYDPTRVSEKDINSLNPAAKIPVRPSAYGKPVGEAVHQFPYRDDGAGAFVQTANAVVNFANMINNQNPAAQGQFVKGNKTLHEYEDVMGHGNGTNQMMAMQIEAAVLTPVKEAIKLNILQFAKNGVIFSNARQTPVEINQVTMRETAVQFKVSDGLLPKSKEMGTDEFQTAFQVLGSSPQIGAAYNLGPLVTYLMALRGADLKPFQKTPEQMQYEQQMAAWQQAAAEAAKAGTEFKSPQPQPSPELQAQMKQMQSNGGINPTSTNALSSALNTTQGG